MKTHWKAIDNCIFCKQSFKDVYKTKEHIIPKSKIHKNNVENYSASCIWCNDAKGCMDAKEFAKFLEIIDRSNISKYNHIRPFIKIMINNAWKLYNKTHKSHENYQKHFK